MSKSIYDEVLEIVNGALDLPDRSVIFKHTALTKLKKVIEKTQKQEKLLGLYRQLILDLGLVIEYDTTDDWNGPFDYEYLEINDNGLESLKTYKKIKELENE